LSLDNTPHPSVKHCAAKVHARYSHGRPEHELVPSRYALKVGAIDVMVISNGVLSLPGAMLGHNVDEAVRAAWLEDMFLSPEVLEWALNAVVVRSGGRTILIDAGARHSRSASDGRRGCARHSVGRRLTPNILAYVRSNSGSRQNPACPQSFLVSASPCLSSFGPVASVTGLFVLGKGSARHDEAQHWYVVISPLPRPVISIRCPIRLPKQHREAKGIGARLSPR
jgi:hypothetical protein